jgi:hypothetical protein
VATGVFCLAGHAYAASGAGRQYGPPPPPAGVPGGFSTVITSVTIGSGGGTIGPVSANGASVAISVPAGAFSQSVQISVTAPDLAAVPRSAGNTVVAGVGVQVGLDGATYPGAFHKPITATMSSSGITPGSTVYMWNGSAFVPDPAATTSAGTATVSFDSDPQFVVETPVSAEPSEVPSATEPVTGEPFLGEGVAAGGLLVLGSGGFVLARRRRRQNQD